VTAAAIAELESKLAARVDELDSALVAFSGGVDSSLVAALAARALSDNALAITAVSPALATGELDGARGVAAAIGIAHETVTTDELSSEDYRRNDRHRCFHCKTELYGRLTQIASERGYAAVLSGANADDAGDWRPGLRAAEDHGVIHPLLEAGVTKQQVRELAERLGVPSAQKPASPCLASRIPYGTPVERGTLQRIDAAEKAVKELGFREVRVRHHGEVGRLEIAADELARARRERGAIERAIRSAGYTRAEIDPKPFRSGSLNLLPMVSAR
jgi:pyridinium-3,5-biscarboxylic acid mononucleotide sulfurtransferase